MKKVIKKIFELWPLNRLLPMKVIRETANTAGQVTLRVWFIQKVLGFNKEAYWPVHHTSVISNIENIKIGIGTAPGLSPSCYIQGMFGVEIGDYTIIAPSVGIISGNHDIYNYTKHVGSKIVIGKYCWIGMGAVILPGVELGDRTIVAAGAVVNESFPEGHCIIGGIPAKIIKILDKNKCEMYSNEYEYYGYIPKKKFEK